MVTWPVSGRAMTGQSPCDPEYRDAFNYGENYTARLKGRDNCFNENKSWIAIHWPKAHVWPYLRRATVWRRIVKSLTLRLPCQRRTSWASKNLFQTLKSLVCDPFKCCCSFLRLPRAWLSIIPPVLILVSAHSLFISYLLSPEPQRIRSKHDFCWFVCFMIWMEFEEFFFPFSGSVLIPLSLSRAKQHSFLSVPWQFFFLIFQAFGSANSQAWGPNYYPKGAH